MKKICNAFAALTAAERLLWGISVVVVTASFVLSGGNVLSLIASLVGVTALIFVSKGHVMGQVLTVVFSVFYGVISFGFRYYGEMITYLCMTAPIAVMAVISWAKNPYKDTDEVQVAHISKKQLVIMVISAGATTAAFYFILGALGNNNLALSTLSVTTSFVASYLTFCRSPYYALGYAANDVVLIVLWILAALEDVSCLPMIFCFVMFLVNDMYGFFNWRKMQKRQSE